MSLYRYVPSKEDLLMLMQEAASELPIPPEREGEHWRDTMREFVRACINAFRKHPWFGDIPVNGAPITPNNLRAVDWLLRATRQLALNDYEKMSIVLLLSSYARSVGIIHRDFDRAMREGSTPGQFSGSEYSEALKRLVTPDRFPDLHPLIMSGAYTGENVEQTSIGDDFDFGLERILDGIEFYLNSKKSDR